eukprot:m.248167 g.248167  ORF g.248167 m.248167 type:complete len:465 (-) comp26470_c4_seq6:5836-7230(-)
MIPKSMPSSPDTIREYLWGTEPVGADLERPPSDLSHMAPVGRSGDAADKFWEHAIAEGPLRCAVEQLEASGSRHAAYHTLPTEVPDDEIPDLKELRATALSDWVTQRNTRVQSVGAATLCVTALTVLVQMTPKLLRALTGDGKKQDASSVASELKKLLRVDGERFQSGDGVGWTFLHKLGHAGVRRCVQAAIKCHKPELDPRVATVGIEAVVAAWALVDDKGSLQDVAKRAMARATLPAAIACVAVTFDPDDWCTRMPIMISHLATPAGEGLLTPKEQTNLVNFTRDVIQFVSKRVPAGSTAAGALLAVGGAGVAAGATPAAAITLAAVLGAEAGTGALIAGLNGAAAQSAALAWLGGGTVAAGGGGVAGGVAVISAVTAGGVLIAAIGSLWLARTVVKSFDNLSDVAKKAKLPLSLDPEPDDAVDAFQNWWARRVLAARAAFNIKAEEEAAAVRKKKGCCCIL